MTPGQLHDLRASRKRQRHAAGILVIAGDVDRLDALQLAGAGLAVEFFGKRLGDQAVLVDGHADGSRLKA